MSARCQSFEAGFFDMFNGLINLYISRTVNIICISVNDFLKVTEMVTVIFLYIFIKYLIINNINETLCCVGEFTESNR